MVENTGRPFLSVPKVQKPPLIDGKVEAEEWADAAEISGLMGATGDFKGRITPEETRVYLAHDGKRFYMAVVCELPPGVKPGMQYRKRDEPVYLDNYQLELWLAPPENGRFVTHQMIGNAYGAIYDNRQIPSLGVADVGWDGKWEFKNSHVRGKYWMAELAIDFAELTDQPVTADQNWRGMVGVAWPQRSWPYTFGFYSNVQSHAFLRFADHGDAVQLHDFRPLLENRFAPSVTLLNSREEEQNFLVDASSGSLEERWEEREVIPVPAGGRGSYSPDQTLAEPAQKGKNLTSTLRVSNGLGELLLDGDWFSFPSGRPEKAVAPSKSANPGEMAVRIQFAPLAGGIRAWADLLDYPGRENVERVRFAVFSPENSENANPLVEAFVTKFDYDSAETYLWLPKNLPFGEYTVSVQFLDKDGAVLDQKESSILHENLRETFVWIDNEYGKDIRVHPPFEPVRSEGKHLSVWGRTMEMEGALPRQVISQGAEMLARPINLVAEIDGRRVEAKILDPFRQIRATPERVDFVGSYELAGMVFTLQGTLEFDGMLFYKMKADLVAGESQPAVDRLFLALPVRGEHALYYFSTAGGWNPAYGLTEPADDTTGLVWDSRQHGNFVPYVGLTDDDRAIQWFADNAHDWVHGEDFPHSQIVREGNVVEVQINLVQRHGQIPAFEADFGLIASPVRPLKRHWRHTVLDAAPMAGSRVNFFYGPGHGNTPIDLHDTRKLAEVLGVDVEGKNPDVVLRDLPPTSLESVPRQQIEAALGVKKSAELDRIWGTGKNDPTATIPCYFYNAKMYFEGNRSEAFRAFHPGEWALDPPSTWFHLTATESYSDFFSFHLHLWFKHWIVPGLYFDEVYLAPDYNVFNGNGKVMPDGSVRPSFALLRQRNYLNRMRQLYFDHEREPFLWVHSTEYMAPYAISAAEIAMFGENRTPTPAADIMDTIPPLLFRSIGRAQKFGFIPVWMTMSGRGGSPWHPAGRQTMAWCWMHDVVPEVHSSFRGRELVALRARWGIDEDDVSFLPYWNTQEKISTDDENFLVSAWTRPGGKVLLLVMNLNKQGAGKTKVRLRLNPGALGLNARFEVKDLESGPVATEYRRMTDRLDALFQLEAKPAQADSLIDGWKEIDSRILQDWGKFATLSESAEFEVEVPARDVRLLMVE